MKKKVSTIAESSRNKENEISKRKKNPTSYPKKAVLAAPTAEATAGS